MKYKLARGVVIGVVSVITQSIVLGKPVTPEQLIAVVVTCSVVSLLFP